MTGLATGVSAAEKGNVMNGITIDTDGNPLPKAFLDVIPITSPTGHKMAESLAVGKILPIAISKEDSETSDEAAAAGPGM